MAQEKTYVVIGVHSRGEYQTTSYLRKCVETLEQHTTNFIPIFVDDFCDEEGTRVIAELAARHTSSYIIRTQKQKWFTRSFNCGLRLVRSKWAVLLNSDVELGEGWLEELYSVRDEAEQQLGQKVGLVGSEFSADEQRRWQNITSPTTPGNPSYCTAHCILLNMEAAQQVSELQGMPGWILDETQQRSIHIFSDNHLSWNLQKLGWATVRSFKSLAGHVGGRSWHHRLDRAFAVQLSDVND